MNRRYRVILIVCFGSLTAGVAYVGAQGYARLGRLLSFFDEIDQSQETAYISQGVFRLLQASESSHRGYLVTGKASCLERYDASRREILERAGTLESRLVGRKEDREAVARLRIASSLIYAEMGLTIDLERAGDHAGAVALVRDGSGEELKKKIREIVGQIDRTERNRMDILRLQTGRYAGSSLALFLALIGGMLTVVVGLYTVINREARDRRRAEAELLASEGRFRGAFEAVAIGMALVAPDGRFLKVNRALCESFGYDEAELLACGFQSITHFDDLEVDLAHVRSLLEGESRSYRMEKQYLHKTGRPIHAVLGVSLVRDDKGRPLYFVFQIEDISSQVLAEDRASEERRFIESVADAVPSILYMYDLPERRCSWSNARVAEILGLTSDQILGLGPSLMPELAHPDDLSLILAHHATLIDCPNGEIRGLDYRMRHADGTWRRLRSRDRVFRRGANGDALQILGSAEDITDRWRAEQELSKETSLRTAIVEAAGYAIISTDERGTIRLFNAAAESLTGFDASEMIGKQSPEIFHDPAEIALRAVEMTRELGTRINPGLEVFVAPIRNGGSYERDWTYVRQDGRRVPIRLSLTAMCDAAGLVTGYVGMASDLTERVGAEASQARLTRILEATTDLVGIADLRGRPIYLNHACRRLCRLKDDDSLEGLRLVEFFPRRAIHELLREAVPSAIRDGSWSGETVVLGGGREIPVSQVIVAHRSPGGVVEYISTIMRDISEHKRLEETLQRARDSAEATARVKAEFLANMSHEIRTPMNGVLGMAELALGTPLTARQRDYVAAIKTSAESLMTVINDILDFSKVEAGKLHLDRMPFGLRELVDDTLRTFALRVAEKGLELCARIGPETPDVLFGDPHRLRQVLLNLVGNAVKFTDRGEVVVSIDLDRGGFPALNDEDLTLEFEVIDTGIGIPEARRASIFEPFEQADGSMTRRFGGTGLGLAISSKLIEMMGGSIHAEERPEGGSVFRFTSRFGRVAFKEVHRFLTPAGLAGKPILIVDDHATGLTILSELLGAWRMEPEAVSDVPSALAAIRRAGDRGRPHAAALVDGELQAIALAAVPGPPLILLAPETIGESPPFGPGRAIKARLAKPIRQSELFNALIDLVGGGEAEARSPLSRQDPGIGIGSERSLRVLVAEDNPVNQVVVTHMLERLGHRVVVVGDGRAALTTVESGLFDVVLMDIQMPHMDGFEAVAAIRDRERSSHGRPRIPILALTAHAMEGDRERCLSSGFDSYLSKPIRAAELSKAIEVCYQPSANSGAVEGKVTFRVEALAESCGGMAEIVVEVLSSFLTQAPADLKRIGSALEAGDLSALRQAAHNLKGACSTVGAEALADTCLRLERLPDGSLLAPVDVTRDGLSRAWDVLRFAIEAHKAELDLSVAAS